MDWKEVYKRKLKTLQEAARMVKDGSEVWAGIAVPVPVALVNALLARENEARDITINIIVDLYPQIKWRNQNRDSNIKVDCGYPTASRDKVQSGDFTLSLIHISEPTRPY